MIVKYIEQKSEAYRFMNASRKKANCFVPLSEIYQSLPTLQRYAVALDTWDYMYLDSGSFVVWYNSDYACITMQELESLFSAVISSIDDMQQIRTIYSVEKVIDSSVKILKGIACEQNDLLAIERLQQFNSTYQTVRSEFIEIITQWFELQN